MEINPKYIQRYWYQIVADQIADEYRQKEYTIYREYQVDDIRADLYAVKEDHKVIIEIVTSEKSNDQIIHLYRAAQQSDCEFRIVSTNYTPFDSVIVFDEFEESFVEYLNCQNPGEFGEFATHSRVDDLRDYELQSISVNGSTITVKGRCVAQLDTWFDNENDTDFTYYVPIAFILDLQYGKHGWEVIEEHKLEIDTSQLDN